MYRVIFEYQDGKKGTCIEGGKPVQFHTKQEALSYASDLNGRIDEDMKHIFPVYRVEECPDEEPPAPPEINIIERIKMVRAMETIARAINHEGIFEEWLFYGVADGDIDENTADEELYYYAADNETFGELMSTFTHMMRKVHTNGGLYIDGVASDKYNGR